MLMEIDANHIFAHCRCKNNLHTKHCILPTLGIAPFPTQLSLLVMSIRMYFRIFAAPQLHNSVINYKVSQYR